LADHKAGWHQTLALVRADPKATRKERNRARDRYGHPGVKKALQQMFEGKCAYCESRIGVVTYGAIEHFRPKSDERFWMLTFEWTNLVKARTLYIRKLLCLLDLARQGHAEARALLSRACGPEGEYLAFVRAIIQPQLRMLFDHVLNSGSKGCGITLP
jgi:hypothetical protein